MFGPLKGSLGGEDISGSEFTVVHPKPGTPQAILVESGDQSAGALLLLKGDEPDAIRLTLQSTGGAVALGWSTRKAGLGRA